MLKNFKIFQKVKISENFKKLKKRLNLRLSQKQLEKERGVRKIVITQIFSDHHSQFKKK